MNPFGTARGSHRSPELWPILALLGLALLSGCIESAQFEGGEDSARADAHDVVRDAVRDGGRVDATLDASERDGSVTDADARIADVPPDVRDTFVRDEVEPDVLQVDGGDAQAAEDTTDVPFPCDSDAACADGLGDAPGPCFVAACHPLGRYCFWRALPNGSLVAAHDACALASRCRQGQPVATVPRDCDDGNACTEDRCDPNTGCVNAPLDDGACDDANACSTEGRCLAGVCVASTNICPCEEDADCAPFDDGDPCNGHLACDGGICVVAPDSVVRCAPPETPGCARLVCDPDSGECVNRPRPDGSPCEDGDACSAGDACNGGVCVAGGPLDCDDENPCTADTCDAADGCGWAPLDDGACDDGDPCTGADACAQGLCRGETLARCVCGEDADCAAFDDDDRCTGALVCVDGFCRADLATVVVCEDCDGTAEECACSRPACAPETGACIRAELPDGRFCEDDDRCTLGDHCLEGACQGGVARTCDDDNPCTADRCDPADGCVYEPTDGACDDGVACTHDDRCDAGVCAGTPYACEGATDCTETNCRGDGTCSDPVLREGFCDIDGVGCVTVDTPHPDDPCRRCVPLADPRAWSPAPDGTGCDDGDPCTTLDACAQGVCAPGAARDCDDGVDCTADTCDAAADACVHTPDDDACDDGNPCTTAVCDSAQGCRTTPVADDTPCDDGDACNGLHACQLGECVLTAGSVVTCPAPASDCLVAICVPATGACSEEVAEDATACDDTDPCTADDACVGGACLGDAVACADDANPCTDDVCDPATGDCGVPLADGTPVPDGDLCDGAETCQGGAVAPGTSVTCEDDANPCTDDVCDPATGTCGVPLGPDVACDDGDPCTAGDVCLDGLCAGADVPDCDPVCASLTACGGGCCPPLPGYTVACNTQDRCEYANEDPTGWRAWDSWIYVPPGVLWMGAPEEETGSSGDDGPVRAVTFTSGYFVAKHETVVATYEACEDAGRCSAPSVAHDDGNGWGLNRSANARESHPQNGIAWQQAGEVCEWLGGRLPSDAEWEYAATGPTHRKYPWGDTPAPTCDNATAVFLESGGLEGYGCGTGGTWPVGSRPAGAAWCGALDMAGNLFEWTEDWYHPGYDDAPLDGSAWIEPAGTIRSMRGGGFGHVETYLHTARRAGDNPTGQNAYYGVRCVRDVSPIGVYCNVACPELPGYTASCNAKDHCEYVRSAPTEPWHDRDVWIWVPPGTFPMGSPELEPERYQNEGPVHDVTFARGFFVAKYETTVAQHEACEAEGSCSEPSSVDRPFEPFGTNRSSNGRADHPQNGLTRRQAAEFCAWVAPQGRLPSEAEWEYAATGPSHTRYPWGDEPTPHCDIVLFRGGCGGETTAPVDARPDGASACGALDMAGNVWEWVSDWYHATYDGAPTDGTAWLEPSSDQGVYRGGAFDANATLLRTATRDDYFVDRRDGNAGVRCVRDLPARSCGGVICPELDTYAATCNSQEHCEFTRVERTEPWHEWDVWIYVPPGEFEMGCSGDGCVRSETPAHTVSFAEGFLIAKFEATVSAHEACEADGACQTPGVHDWGEEWGVNRSVDGRASHPQNGLAWSSAKGFCAWASGRLPSESEWERAARGSDGRLYPWGGAPPPSCDPTYAIFNEFETVEGRGCGTGGTGPVDAASLGVSPTGLQGAAGNVWEWVEDCWHETYAETPGAPSDGSAWDDDCGEVDRVHRGGAFHSSHVFITTTARPTNTGDPGVGLGVRCARDVPEGCNGIDDDGDGLTDADDVDDLMAAGLPLCDVQEGVCAGASRSAALCAGGTWQACADIDYAAHSLSFEPDAELSCDDLDNDCDGETDEGCDDDRDGWCDEGMSVEGSPAVCPEGPGDCDDDSSPVNPAAAALCGVDADCDGDRRDPGESCDDGNDDDADGCSFCTFSRFDVSHYGERRFMHAATALAARSGGGYVVAWYRGWDGSTSGLHVQSRSAFGRIDASWFWNGTGASAALGTAPTGDVFVVAGSGATALQGYVLDSAFTPVAGPVIVSDAGSHFRPAIARTADSGYLVLWTGCPGDNCQTGSEPIEDGYDVFARHVGLDGGLVGAEFRVNSHVDHNQGSLNAGPRVASLGGSTSVAAWDSVGQDGDEESIVARVITSPTGPSSGELSVNTTTAGGQTRPDIAALPGGGFVVVWQSDGQDGSQGGVYGQRYDPEFGKTGPEFPVNLTTDGHQGMPRVAANGSGSFLVVWTGASGNVVGRLFDALGSPATDEIGIGSRLHDSLSVAALEDGGFVVVWNNYESTWTTYWVFGRRLTADGGF